jgi:hypothetical protein
LRLTYAGAKNASGEKPLTPKEETIMKAEFYDVKERKKVNVDVTEKVTYGEDKRKRFALRAKTSDGRNLTKFVGKADWEKAKV